MMDIRFRRTDGSFVALINDMPYHITTDEPVLYAMALEHGINAPHEPAPPVPAPTTKGQQELARRLAYVEEADPLFFMAQRGEALEQEWLEKVAEIKARYPYPVE